MGLMGVRHTTKLNTVSWKWIKRVNVDKFGSL